MQLVALLLEKVSSGARATSRDGEYHLGAPRRPRMRWDGVETSHDVGTALLSAVRVRIPSSSGSAFAARFWAFAALLSLPDDHFDRLAETPFELTFLRTRL